MRSLLVVLSCLLALGSAGRVRADQQMIEIPNAPPPPRPAPSAPKGPYEPKLIIAGVSIFFSVYLLTDTLAPIFDFGCGLGGLAEKGPPSCPSHTALYIPIVGGFFNAAQNSDGSAGLGVVSSLLQTAGLAMVVAGSVLYQLRTDRAQKVVPYVGPGGVGVRGRF